MPSHFLLEKLINHSSHHLGAKGGMNGDVGGPVLHWLKGDISKEMAVPIGVWLFGEEQPVTTIYRYLESSQVF